MSLEGYFTYPGLWNLAESGCLAIWAAWTGFLRESGGSREGGSGEGGGKNQKQTYKQINKAFKLLDEKDYLIALSMEYLLLSSK